MAITPICCQRRNLRRVSDVSHYWRWRFTGPFAGRYSKVGARHVRLRVGKGLVHVWPAEYLVSYQALVPLVVVGFWRCSLLYWGESVLSLLITTFAIATASGGGLPVKTPRAVGMSSERLAKIDHVVERGISAGGYPGASVVVGRRGAAVWEKGFGTPELGEATVQRLPPTTRSTTSPR